MLRLVIRSGTSKGRSFEAAGEVVRIGRAPGNDLVLEDIHVSAEHARIVLGPAAPMLEDLRSTNGTTLVAAGPRTVLGEGAGYKAALETGDVIELGSGDAVTAITVSVADERDETRVVAVRKIDDLGRITAGIERNPRSLSALYRAQKRIGASTDLEETLIAVADAVLSLVPNATHVTVVLRDVDGSRRRLRPHVDARPRRDRRGDVPRRLGAHHAQRLSQGGQRARRGARRRRAARRRSERVAHGRLHPQHHRRPALERGRDPRRRSRSTTATRRRC